MSALAAMVAAASEMQKTEDKLVGIRRTHSRVIGEVIAMEQKQQTLLQSFKLGEVVKPLMEGVKAGLGLPKKLKGLIEDALKAGDKKGGKKDGGSGGSGGGSRASAEAISSSLSIQIGGGVLGSVAKTLGMVAIQFSKSSQSRSASIGSGGGGGGASNAVISFWMRQAVGHLKDISGKLDRGGPAGSGAPGGKGKGLLQRASEMGKRAANWLKSLGPKRKPKGLDSALDDAPPAGKAPGKGIGGRLGNAFKSGLDLAKKGAGSFGKALSGAFNLVAKGAGGVMRMVGAVGQGLMRMGGMALRVAGTVGKALVPALVGIGTALVTPPGIIATAAVAVAGIVGITAAAGALAGAFSAALPTLQSFGGAFVFAKGFEMAKPFMEAGQQLEASQRAMASVVGSSQGGKDMVDYVQRYRVEGGTSLDQGKLETTAMTLASGGVDVTQHLKTAEMLALKSGKPVEQVLPQIAAYLADVNTGQADASGLDQFGIDSTQFAGQEGEGLLSSLNTSLSGDSQVQDLMSMSDTGLAQVEQGLAGIQSVVQDIGVSFGEVFGPILKEAGVHLMNIAESGVFDQIIKGFAELFGMGEGGENPLVDTINAVVGFLAGLPEKIQAFLAAFKKVAAVIQNIAGKVQKAVEMASAPARAIGSGFRWIKDKVFGWATGHIEGTKNVTRKAAKEGEQKEAESQEQLRKTLQIKHTEAKEKKITDTSAPTPPKEEKVDPKADLVTALNESNAKSVQHLANIDRQTEQLVQANRLMAGGGQLGRLGISAIEASKMSYGERSRSGPRARRVAAMIEDAITELMHETLGQERRQQGTRYA